MDIRTDMNRVRISYLSNGTDTDITLSASMDIHLHPYAKKASHFDKPEAQPTYQQTKDDLSSQQTQARLYLSRRELGAAQITAIPAEHRPPPYLSKAFQEILWTFHSATPYWGNGL
jgi:hypothetical protein